jgi:GT2 family glycosyltransferase
MAASREETEQAGGGALRRVGCLAVGLFGAWRTLMLVPVLSEASPAGACAAVFLAAVEIGASFYLVSALLKALAYPKLLQKCAPPPPETRRCPPVALVYLTCDDLDREALCSLARVRYTGPLFLILHDDSVDPAHRRSVDEAVARLREEWDRPVVLLRRPEKSGGKPAAVNWIVTRTSFLHQFFLLCDNDSVALDPEFLPRALARFFEDPSVAAVQFRNRGRTDPRESPLHRFLARAVDAFDVFVRYYACCGLTPFLGHNAMIRTDVFRTTGGFRPGMLSDDVEFTVRLALEGRRVVYAPEVEFGERHPASYGAFRRRCQKWAYGCMQILSRYALTVLRSRRLTGGQKVWFFEFASFYVLQCLLLLYLVVAFVATPFLLPGAPAEVAGASGLAGLLVVLGIAAPLFAYFRIHRPAEAWWKALWCCALVYGSSAFATARGTLEWAAGRTKSWIPTNASRPEGFLGASTVCEALFGLLLLAVPLALDPRLLLGPATYLFISVFLFAPLVHRAYRHRPPEPEGHPRPARSGGWSRFRTVGIVLALVGAAVASLSGTAGRAGSEISVREGQILVEGRAFPVRGIHYSPWPPGTGPAKDYSYPGEGILRRDFELLADLNVNTLLVHDAPRTLLERASRAGFRVIYTFTLDWHSIGDDASFRNRVREISAKVEKLRDEPSLLLWSLGNEIPEWIYREKGADFLAGRLKELYEAVIRVDPSHPVTHQNWPVTKDLDLPFLEVVSFNLYPSWPREVVVRGYGEYIEKDLKPRAAGRPLLITEFGISSLEVTVERQAETLRKCWEEIRRRTAGGVVFEFVDEWWKNYDNPIAPPDYWHREYAPDDEKSQDLDPEEYYGIFTSDRIPKAAAGSVRAMFRPVVTVHQAWFLIPLLALLAYTLYVFRRL